MTYRVIQWATGNTGKCAIRGILDHPELELVGVKVFSDRKHGVDAGTLCNKPSTGVKATTSMDAILALEADCVVYMPLLPDKNEIIALLQNGKSVVVSNGWYYTAHRDVADLEAACKEGNSVLHGTGIHPGGITERLPLMVSSFIANIRSVRAEEFSDLRSYDAPNVVTDIMLFGKPPSAADKSPMLELLKDGFGQSVDMVADAIGARLDENYQVVHRFSVAIKDIESPFGKLEKGTIAAQHFSWQGTIKGTPIITAAVNWYMGNDNLEPGWDLGSERFEMEVIGDNRIQLVTDGLHAEPTEAIPEHGLLATAMHCVNAVPYVCKSEPGLRSYLDMPMIAGRIDQSFARHCQAGSHFDLTKEEKRNDGQTTN